jgi:hypothetical protein
MAKRRLKSNIKPIRSITPTLGLNKKMEYLKKLKSKRKK